MRSSNRSALRKRNAVDAVPATDEHLVFAAGGSVYREGDQVETEPSVGRAVRMAKIVAHAIGLNPEELLRRARAASPHAIGILARSYHEGRSILCCISDVARWLRTPISFQNIHFTPQGMCLIQVEGEDWEPQLVPDTDANIVALDVQGVLSDPGRPSAIAARVLRGWYDDETKS